VWSLPVQVTTSFFIPGALIKEKASKSISKQILNCIKQSIPQLKDAKLYVVENVKLQSHLLHLAELKDKDSKCYSIGILYVKENQTTEEQILSNENGSEAFTEFILFLGKKIELKDWSLHRGNLDVTNNSNGTHSIFAKWKHHQVMFHVSTYLPYSANAESQIGRKKFIGNDITTIVFLDGENATFVPPAISGDFLHIFAVIRPCKTVNGEPGYELGVASKNGVRPFGPNLPSNPIFPRKKYFKDFLLTKLLNGHRAAIQSPFMASKLRKTRNTHITSIIQEFGVT